MSDIVLQHLIMSSGIVKGTEGLFCRTHKSFPISLSKDGVVDFDCHFNLFDIGIYKRCTRCRDYRLVLDADGDVEIIIQGCDGSTIISVNDKVCPIPETGNDVIYFRIRGLSDCMIRSIDIRCECDRIRDVRLSLCICTYRNEQCVREKISGIKGYFAKIEEDTPGIIITDNGRTLEDIDGTTIIRSDNLGGSGGFTKAMMAAMDDGAEYIILNDDDAVFEPEVLYRVQRFLSVLDEEHQDVSISGTMLDIDHMTKVVKSGAKIIDCDHIPLKKGLDVSISEDNEKLAEHESSDYSGWWFYVLSRRTIEQYGYPLPLFLKNDDVEYGLRTGPDIVRILSVSVWHPSFSSKYSPVNHYYDIRNLLIAMSIHGDVKIENIISKILLDVSAYRYLSAEAMIAGIEDYLKGPSYVFPLCKDGMKTLENDDIGTITELKGRIDEKDIDVKKGRFRFRKYTMNGLFLPSKGDRILPADCMHTEDFYRVGRILYTIDDKRGFIARRKRMRTIKDVLKVMRLKNELKRGLPSLMSSYKESLQYRSSREGWMEFFGK